MRIAFVVQRYGLEVSGGSELHCRQWVEHLRPYYEIEVLTTCAQDYVTWENSYPPGLDDVNGIPVRRFPVVRPRAEDFGEFSAKIFARKNALQDEIKWLCDQGPLAPELIEFIGRHRFDYDVFVFFTYIYYPTALGCRMVPERAVLVPTAHNEPPLYLNMYKALFHSPRTILYNTPEEKRLVHTVFGVDYIPHDVVGVGLDLPSGLRPDAFREKYDIDGPYVIYVGRISRSKNCDTLLEYFARYKKTYPDEPLKLVLVGKSEFGIPDDPDILPTGFVSDPDKFDAMAGARALLMPSKLESLSIVLLESMGVGVPVLCAGDNDVLRGHCIRSNAGLYYRTYPEFAESLRFLLGDGNTRARLGRNGTRYVADNYTWEIVVEKCRRMIEYVGGWQWDSCS
jgi:glycosyltransferase involved in cell wall biosynthesis